MKDLYQNGRYFTFYCEESNRWVVCREVTPIKSKVILYKDTQQQAKDCVDSAGAE